MTEAVCDGREITFYCRSALISTLQCHKMRRTTEDPQTHLHSMCRVDAACQAISTDSTAQQALILQLCRRAYDSSLTYCEL